MYQKPPGLDAALSRDGVPPVRVSLVALHSTTQFSKQHNATQMRARKQHKLSDQSQHLRGRRWACYNLVWQTRCWLRCGYRAATSERYIKWH